ncbi:hypothetical protein C9374_013268 [Naegleria lovaniensis]|uniref:Exocyst complex component Sec8 n=1 Tax=Naegleria lovaniensis TaxID=51637 RepID=A0AA88GZ08_NAELO|nr:uncharacterized protein C9374_013268 [Naegleria lovaniensis]KAG2391783.1 hypothetical protein C9374_013268 [Naegleria lovaniensis]
MPYLYSNRSRSREEDDDDEDEENEEDEDIEEDAQQEVDDQEEENEDHHNEEHLEQDQDEGEVEEELDQDREEEGHTENQEDEEQEFDEKLEEMKELESEVLNAIDSVPTLYSQLKTNHITIVAQSLIHGTHIDDLNELTEHYDTLSDALSKLVAFNYQEFNKSIRNFSDILAELTESQKKIQQLRNEVRNTKSCLTSHAIDLSSLYTNYLQHSEYLRILNIIHQVKEVPEKIAFLIEKKHFSNAIKLIQRSCSFLKNSEELKFIKGLEEIRSQIKNYEKKLPELMINVLTTHLYSVDVEKCKVDANNIISFKETNIQPNHQRPASINNEIIRKEIDRHEYNRKLGRAISYENEFGVYAKTPNLFDFDVGTDLSFDPEQDSNYFLSMLIDGLDTLGKLSLLQSRMVHSLQFDIRSLIEKHILDFVSQMNETSVGSKSKPDPSKDHHKITNSNRLREVPFITAMIQGKTLQKLFQKIFDNIVNLLKKYNFMIGIMELRAASLDFSSLSQSSDLIATPLDIKVSKPVLTKIKEAVKQKLEHLKSANPKSNAKEVHKLYATTLEELLSNFLQTKLEEDLYVRDIISLFENQIVLKTTRQNLSAIETVKEKFVHLITETVSDSSCPHTFTATYVWKTAQEEIKTVLRDLFGLSNMSLLGAPEKSNSTDSTKTKDSGVPTSIDDFSVSFKYSNNIDVYEHLQEEKTIDSSSIISTALSRHFILSPYNLLWAYKEVIDFIEKCNSIIFDESESSSSSSSEYTSLKEFCDETVRHFLLSIVRNDYRTKISELFRKHSHAFSSVHLKDFKVHATILNTFGATKTVFYGSMCCLRWIYETISIARTIPVQKPDFYGVVEQLLKRYLDENTTFFDLAISTSYCQQILKQCREVLPFLISEALFVRAQQWRPQQLKQPQTDVDHIRRLFEQHVDVPIRNLVFDPSRKSHIIDRTSGFISLATLNNTLEWVLENIYKFHYEIVQNLPSSTKIPQHNNAKTKPRRLLTNPNTVVALLANSSFQIVKHLEDYYDKIVSIYNDCLLAIKIDLRIRCFYYIDRGFSENIKEAAYDCEEQIDLPESFVEEFNKDMHGIHRALSTHLSEDKMTYVFGGLGKFVSDLLIGTLVSHCTSSKEPTIPNFSKVGVEIMKRNITALQQQISAITQKHEQHFNFALEFYNLLLLEKIQLLYHVKSVTRFTKQQYLAAFRIITRNLSEEERKKAEKDFETTFHRATMERKSASSALKLAGNEDQ